MKVTWVFSQMLVLMQGYLIIFLVVIGLKITYVSYVML